MLLSVGGNSDSNTTQNSLVNNHPHTTTNQDRKANYFRITDEQQSQKNELYRATSNARERAAIGGNASVLVNRPNKHLLQDAGKASFLLQDQNSSSAASVLLNPQHIHLTSVS